MISLYYKESAMIFLVYLGVSLSGVKADRTVIGSCQFTRDCQVYPVCQNIADAGCVCNFGKCIISGFPFFRGTECQTYTDCACRENPDKCFCKEGFCHKSEWECHKAADCKKMKKCEGIDCTCQGNLCEYECSKDADCADYDCNKALGYKCKCENSLCAYKRTPKECQTISDCVAKGKCVGDAPCACTQNYCTLPWWVETRDQEQNCRTDKDCEDTIASCKGYKCACLDKKKNPGQWFERGTCREKNNKPRMSKQTNVAFPPIIDERMSIGSCQFTRDCQVYPVCQNIADAGCVCNFGKCIISGFPFFRGTECQTYTDCPCSGNPDKCFCKEGFCHNTQWECHKAADCKKMKKCEGIDCTCQGNLCEFECSKDIDCAGHYCNKAEGYTCKCENSLCAYKRKPSETDEGIVEGIAEGIFEEKSSCQFTRDCQVYPVCQNIADGGCVCNFGKCIISSFPFFRGTECQTYTDCACRQNPEKCFCKEGFCHNTEWECHKAADCKKMKKCEGVDCTCRDNLCENECSKDADCSEYDCNKALGYKCKCENSLCAYKRKPIECQTISGCVYKGKCVGDAPCACTQNYCTLPWWVETRDQEQNCRTDKDCEDTIASCRGNKCACLDKKKNPGQWFERGTCFEMKIVF